MKKNLSEIPLDLVQALVVFHQENNVDRAARLLGMNQSTLSRKLMQLEEKFDLQLFQKDGREKRLTQFGISLCEKMNPLIKTIRTQLQLSQDEFSDERKVVLKFGGRLEFISLFLKDRDFLGQWEIQNLSSQQVIKSLNERQIDCGITHLELNSYDYLSVLAWEDFPVVVIPKKIMPEKCDLKKWAEICHQFPVVSYNQEFLFIKEFARLFGLKKSFATKLLFPDWNHIEQACAEQKGWTIMPGRFVRDSHRYQVLTLPKEPKYSFKMFFYFRKEYAKMEWFKKKILLTKN